MSAILDITIVILSICQYVSTQMMHPMPYPGLPPMPFPSGPMPFPSGSMPFPSGPMAFPPPMPGMMPSPMHLPGPIPIPQPKLPVVVMPYYSKNKKGSAKKHKKRRRLKIYSDSSSSDSGSSDSSSSAEFKYRATKREKSFRSGKNRRRQVLTPVVSYVTKEGYVVYQKKIKKDKAKDWLQIGRRSHNHDSPEVTKDKGMSVKDIKKKISSRFSKHKRNYE
jgi:hypothetical protein